MKKKIFRYVSILFFGMLIFTACKSAPEPKKNEPNNSQIKINSVSWLIERLHPSIWDKSLKDNSEMFISFYISYSGKFDLQQIKNIAIQSPIDLWNVDSAQLEKVVELQEEKNLAIVKRLPCGEKQGAVPLGNWIFLLNDKQGYKYKQELNVNGFEKTDKEEIENDEPIQSVKKEEPISIKRIVPTASKKDEIEALKMPVINSVSKDEDSIEIYFTVNDERIKNGYFWFSVPNEEYYKDSGSMIDASNNPVNGCREFRTDGKKSRYILRKNSENEEWFNNIEAIFFVVSDTNRVASPWEERIRTVSAGATVK